ncbi:MAG: efflux transporter outer membrane subunit [Burkholderiales bacterium]|jgi:NodT family efflux transporter outer membrane factor (OMF) lipoprotein|nr:efflux transporter outer membrane subunit [Burkholderiales bacterium]
MSLKFRWGLLVCAVAALGGCAVGPDFKSPEAPAAARYTETPLPEQTVAIPAVTPGGAAQRFVVGEAGDLLRGEPWWSLFQNTELNRLIEQALANSPTLAEAEARLRQAQEEYAARAGTSRYPAVDLGVSAARQQVNVEAMGITAIPSPPPFTLYNASVGVSYTFDWFGANARALEGLQAATEIKLYQWEAARLTLAANITAAVVREASLREQIDVLDLVIEAQRRQLAILEARRALGGVSDTEVQNVKSVLADTQARLPPLQRLLHGTRHQLASYLGQTPGEVALPSFRLADLRLPETLPLTVPSELVRQRPDIRAAEAMLHQASAQVGVATANLYPRLTLSGNFGSAVLSGEKLFADGFNLWNLGAGVTQPLFRGGELRAYKRAAEAAFDAAAAGYRQTVLQGFQNVADALRALETDALALEARSAAAGEARATYRLMEARHRLGGVDQWAVLDAERRYLETQLAQIQSTADRYADTVALFQAMGTGAAGAAEALNRTAP